MLDAPALARGAVKHALALSAPVLPVLEYADAELLSHPLVYLGYSELPDYEVPRKTTLHDLISQVSARLNQQPAELAVASQGQATHDFYQRSGSFDQLLAVILG